MINTTSPQGTTVRAPYRRGRPANDNHKDYIEDLRKRGYSIRVIAAELGVSVGMVCRALYATKRQAANDNTSVVRLVTTIGIGGHMTCQRVPVRMPRVQMIDGAAA